MTIGKRLLAHLLQPRVLAIISVLLVCVYVIGGMLPALVVALSTVPFLAIILCAVPCLIPLAFLRKQSTPSENSETSNTHQDVC